MPSFPPIIDGLTKQPSPGPPMGGLLQALLGGMGDDQDEGGTGLDSVQDAIADLHKAVRLQPSLADRVEKALAILEGTDDDEEASPGSGDSSLPSFMTANAKTPV